MATTLRTPEKVTAILTAIRVKGNASKACADAKISRYTWYGWLDQDPDLRVRHEEAMRIGRANRADRAEDKLMERVEKGDTTAIIFALKTLRRDIYGDRSLHELSGADGSPLTITIVPRPDGPD